MPQKPLPLGQVLGSPVSDGDTLREDLQRRQALVSMMMHFPVTLLLRSPPICRLLQRHLHSDPIVRKMFKFAVEEQKDLQFDDDGLDEDSRLCYYDDRREFWPEIDSGVVMKWKPSSRKFYAYANDILVEGPPADPTSLIVTTMPTQSLDSDEPVTVTYKPEHGYKVAAVALTSVRDLIVIAEVKAHEAPTGELHINFLSMRDLTEKHDSAAQRALTVPLVGPAFVRLAKVEIRVVGDRILASCIFKKKLMLVICEWTTGQLLVNTTFKYDPNHPLAVDLLHPNIFMVISDGSDDIDKRVSNSNSIDDMSVPKEYCIKLYSTEQHMTRLLCLQLPLLPYRDEHGHTIKLVSGSNISPLAPGKPFAWTAPPRISAIHILPGITERRSKESPTIILPHYNLLEIAKRFEAIDTDDKPLLPKLDPVPWEGWGPNNTRIISCLRPWQRRCVLASEMSVGGAHGPFYLLNEDNPAAIHLLAFESDEPTLEVSESLRTVVDSKWYQPDHPWTLTRRPSRYRSPCFQSDMVETRLPYYKKHFTLSESDNSVTQSDEEEA